MTTTPTTLKYVPDHHWVQELRPATIRMGITDFAQESLGDVIAIDLPHAGTRVEAGQPLGEIESVKSVSDLVAPVSGVITAVNDRVDGEPELTNTDPYGDGWLVDIDVNPSDYPTESAALLDADQYRALTGK
jgi:glycine cleavage system H protein